LESSGAETATRLEISGGAVTNTANSANGRAIYNASTGGVTISGGTVEASNGYAVHNNTTGALTVSGGTVANILGNANARAINNASTGAVTISGGTVKTTAGNAVYNNNTGAVSISGGRVEATTGMAVYNVSTGKITVSNYAVITSANETAANGTIYLATATGTATRLEMTGGTVENTANNANARAIYNASTGGVIIGGGTVKSVNGYTVHNNIAGALTVSGGTIENMFNNANAHAINNVAAGTITISGGTVKATEGKAVYQNNALNLTGGAVFAYGTSDADVITGSYMATGGNGIILAWNQAAGNTTYTDGTTTDIYKSTGGASTATWLTQEGKVGINYANGANTGFVVIDALESTKNDYDMSGVTFENDTVTCDNNPHSIFIGGTPLPATLTVEYIGNGQTAPGEYEVTARFTTTDYTYNNPDDMKAMLMIKSKNNYDMSGIRLDHTIVAYDGNEHSILISGTLPAGLTVDYTGNNQSAEGFHAVKATFSTTNATYNTPAAMEAMLVIQVNPLNDSIATLNGTITLLEEEIGTKNDSIAALNSAITQLRQLLDDCGMDGDLLDTVLMLRNTITGLEIIVALQQGEIIVLETENDILQDSVALLLQLLEDCGEGNSISEPVAPAPLQVYPNPFTDVLHIADAENGTLRVMNASGAVVHTQAISSDGTVRLQHLPAGVYILFVETNGRVKTSKVVKR
jgi:hypothetical protein